MAKLDGLKIVLDFIKSLQPKIAAQIAKKVLALNVDPLPSDSLELTGYLTSCTFSIIVRWAMPTLRYNKHYKVFYSQ